MIFYSLVRLRLKEEPATRLLEHFRCRFVLAFNAEIIMKQIKIYKGLVWGLILSTIVFTGCSKFLEVYPKSSLAEDQMFDSQIGFQQALTGVYSLLATQDLYGDNLTMGFTSALAQNYNPTSTNAYFYNTKRYNYTSDEVRNYTASIWGTSYNAIAAANNIIAHTVSNRSVLSENSYNEIRGEALALRALLHFDLLRIFAPSMTVGADVKAIPYRTSVDQFSQIPSTVEEVISLALEDLDEAESLLRISDEILSGTTSRQIKINYYAVKALQARINLYKGDNTKAYEAAKVVVDAGAFPFVSGDNVNTTYGKDYLFKDELVFGLRVRDIQTWAVDLYFGRYRSDIGVPNLSLTQYQTLYQVSGVGGFDSRWNYLIVSPTGASSTIRTTAKYLQTWTQTSTDDRLDQLVPMIRISEMYYILAETAPDLGTSVNWLNEVRIARNIAALTASTLTQQIFRQELTREYQKEFYAEGQLFYYYKRMNATTVQFLSGTFTTSNYVLPIPDSELEVNPNY